MERHEFRENEKVTYFQPMGRAKWRRVPAKIVACHESRVKIELVDPATKILLRKVVEYSSIEKAKE